MKLKILKPCPKTGSLHVKVCLHVKLYVCG